MKKIIQITCLSFALVLFAGLAQANPGDYEPPDFKLRGINVGQKQVFAAWLQLKPFILACAYSDECGLSEDERKLIRRSAQSIQAYSQDSIVFKSERENPGLFQSSQGELHRLVVTGDNPNSPIFVNSDLVPAIVNPPEFAKWMGILAHEFMHHQGFKDDSSRIPDQFGSKIAKAAEIFLNRHDVGETDGGVQIWILNLPQPMSTMVFDQFPNGTTPRAFLVQTENIWHLSNLDRMMIFQNECPAGEALVAARMNPHNETQTERDANQMRYVTKLYQTNIYCLSRDRKNVTAVNQLHELRFQYRATPNAFEINLNTIQGNRADDSDARDGTETRVSIKSVTVTTPRVQAGQTAKWRAVIQDLGMGVDAVDCGGSLTRDGWPMYNAGVPLSVYSSRCRILSRNDDLYEVELELDIPLTASPGELIIARIGLNPTFNPDDGSFTSYPARKTVFEIVNAQQPALTIKKTEIINATPFNAGAKFTRWYHIPKNSLFTFAIEFEGMVEELDDASFSGFMSNEEQKRFSFEGPLISSSDFFVKAVRVSKIDNKVRYEFDCLIPVTSDYGPLALLKFEKMMFITKDFKPVTIEFAETDFGVAFSEYVSRNQR